MSSVGPLSVKTLCMRIVGANKKYYALSIFGSIAPYLYEKLFKVEWWLIDRLWLLLALNKWYLLASNAINIYFKQLQKYGCNIVINN